MKIPNILTAFISIVAVTNAAETWNILSLDGGGIRGLFTATVVEYMEYYAYNYSVATYCYPQVEEGVKKRVPLFKLFDMVAGTSTGSLLATMVALPDPKDPKKKKYFAEDAIDIY